MDINEKNCPNQDLASEIIEFIHFIRTPLASIKIGSHILKETLPLLINPYKKGLLVSEKDGIVTDLNKIDKLASIINNILIEANRISEHTQKIELQITNQNIDPKEYNA